MSVCTLHLTEADRPWLESALADESRPERQPVALHALLDLWNQRGRIPGEVDAIRAALREDATLERILAERTAPPKRNAEIERMERDNQRLQRAQDARDAERLQNWMNWRKELLADPDNAFAPDKQLVTVANLHAWLETVDRSRSHRNVWNKDALTQAFGGDIAKRTVDTLKALWRVTPTALWSARPPEERDSTPNVWLYGLCGLSAEASTPRWATSLNSDEARIAAAYATVEINGFASFISDLAVSHPIEVDAVLGGELSEQLSVGSDHNHLPILQDLRHANSTLKQLLIPRLLGALPMLPATFTAETGARWAHHLDYVMRILEEIIGEADRRSVADVCVRRYEADPIGPLALTWLRGLFGFDPQRGAQALTVGLAAGSDQSAGARAIESFAGLFGEGGALVFVISNLANRARALGILVRSAYSFIRREDDQAHEGVYSQNIRDQAESARNFLLSALLDTPGPEARRVILELATEPDFAHFPDRLRLLARQRAAADGEADGFDAEAIADLESRNEAPPRDRDGLFRVMTDRLDDLAHDLTHCDFTDRRTLRRISDEIEMQRTLAWRIDAKAKGAFVVTREEEVADQKRTDIRVSAVRCDQKGVIEVKLADTRWSLTDLEQTLRNQIVGQYLRHETCKAGCLLLTYDGQKKFWIHPVTRKRLNFTNMVTYLNEKARALEIDNLHRIRLAVFGLDLTDPVLAPAHH